jgi:transposase
MKWFLGIDIAKEKFDAALVEDDGTLRRRKTCANTSKGHAEFVEWLRSVKVGNPPIRDLHIGMEATNTYADDLATALWDAGYRVSVLNPAAVHAYAASNLSRNKTDSLDAETIANYVRTHQPRLWTPRPPEERELQALARRLDALVELRQRERNRLESARVESVRASLQRVLDDLHDEIQRLKEAIRQHIQQHPRLKEQADLLASIPSVGEATVRLLLAEFRWDRFENVRQVVAFAGLNPKKDASGKREGRTPLSKIGSARIRKGLYLPAVVAKKRNPVLKALYDRLLEHGKAPMEAIGAVMRKLLHLAYGVLKSGKPFDPEWAKSA